jgi:hypothetical protein
MPFGARLFAVIVVLLAAPGVFAGDLSGKVRRSQTPQAFLLILTEESAGHAYARSLKEAGVSASVGVSTLSKTTLSVQTTGVRPLSFGKRANH